MTQDTEQVAKISNESIMNNQLALLIQVLGKRGEGKGNRKKEGEERQGSSGGEEA